MKFLDLFSHSFQTPFFNLDASYFFLNKGAKRVMEKVAFQEENKEIGLAGRFFNP